MDGNGRWARQRGRPRVDGHREGARAVERTVEAAPALDISDLTLYAFSADNWQRPPDEVALLMSLFERYLREQTPRCAEKGIRVGVIGRRDRLAPSLVRAIARCESRTAKGRRLYLRLAVDYSSREALVAAARSGPDDRDSFARSLAAACSAAVEIPPVDLLIRTGREKRLSDFLLWEAAYAELHFTDVMWPEFGEADLAAAVRDFHTRQRRFGRLPEEEDAVHAAV